MILVNVDLLLERCWNCDDGLQTVDRVSEYYFESKDSYAPEKVHFFYKGVKYNYNKR